MLSQTKRHNEMLQLRKQQPYETRIGNITIMINEDVFPSDHAYATEELMNAIKKYHGNIALDLGCGCGILALAMYEQNFKEIIAIDRHFPAIECTIQNVKKNNASDRISTLYGDLFEPIKNLKKKNDLIVFNPPYFPTVGKPVFGDDPDGGHEILERFFSGLKAFIHCNSKIILPFSEISGQKNNPANIAKSHNYDEKIIFEFSKSEQKHIIYEFSLKNGLQINT